MGMCRCRRAVRGRMARRIPCPACGNAVSFVRSCQIILQFRQSEKSFALTGETLFYFTSVTAAAFRSAYAYAFSFSEKSDIASEILICCGHTFSQLLHPMQALGSFSSGSAISAIGARNPPPVKQCSL